MGELTVDNQNAIIDKAENKPDGVYSFRGIMFRVRNGKVKAFVCGGRILMAAGIFNYVSDSYATQKEARDKLKGIE